MTINRKGIILAGGRGTRLYPSTKIISKQLLPLYDKPLIYYPLTTLMLANIREILLISTSKDIENYKSLFGSGKELGITIEYAVQERPNGIAEAFLIAENFIEDSYSALILGDNLFYGSELPSKLISASEKKSSTIFAYQVSDPKRYGVLEFDENFKAINLEEKPKKPKSNFAITGLYFFDKLVCKKVRKIKPSSRNELEITELIKIYLNEDNLNVEKFGRGVAWIDTGTPESLFDASSYVKTIETRQGLKIGCPEEVAWRMGYINRKQLTKIIDKFPLCSYKQYLNKLIKQEFNIKNESR